MHDIVDPRKPTHLNGWEGIQQTQIREACVRAGLTPNTTPGRSNVYRLLLSPVYVLNMDYLFRPRRLASQILYRYSFHLQMNRQMMVL